jgi:hypothetical protein
MIIISLISAGNIINTPRIMLIITIVDILELKISFKILSSGAPFKASLGEGDNTIIPPGRVKV